MIQNWELGKNWRYNIALQTASCVSRQAKQFLIMSETVYLWHRKPFIPFVTKDDSSPEERRHAAFAGFSMFSLRFRYSHIQPGHTCRLVLWSENGELKNVVTMLMTVSVT